MRSIHTAVILVFVGVAWLMMALFKPSSTVPEKLETFSGTYLTEKDNELSWIEIVEDTKSTIICEWRKLTLMPDGKVKPQSLVFTGKREKERLSMTTHISNPKRFIVFANALREEGNIRMSLSVEGMVFYTGLYKPVSVTDVISAKNTFVQEAAAITQEKENERKTRLPPEDEAFKQRQRNNSLIRVGNYYVSLLREFKEGHKKTVKQFEDKTTSMALYLQHTKGAYDMKQAGGYARQYFKAMQGILDSTRELQNNQDALQAQFSTEMLSFLDGLKKKQALCAQPNHGGETASMCKAVASLEENIRKQSVGVQDMFNVIRESYKINSRKQKKMIDEAKEYIGTVR